jgi:hypothetical protein
MMIKKAVAAIVVLLTSVMAVGALAESCENEYIKVSSQFDHDKMLGAVGVKTAVGLVGYGIIGGFTGVGLPVAGVSIVSGLGIGFGAYKLHEAQTFERDEAEVLKLYDDAHQVMMAKAQGLKPNYSRRLKKFFAEISSNGEDVSEGASMLLVEWMEKGKLCNQDHLVGQPELVDDLHAMFSTSSDSPFADPGQ